jgi:hypothetical protein
MLPDHLIIELRYLFTQLLVQGTSGNSYSDVPMIRDSLSSVMTVKDCANVFRASAKRMQKLRKIADNIAVSDGRNESATLLALCPTRWCALSIHNETAEILEGCMFCWLWMNSQGTQAVMILSVNRKVFASTCRWRRHTLMLLCASALWSM